MTSTVFLRLSGPMQSWGTGSRLQLRRSDAYPSKSGVLGMILCAAGVRRDAAPSALAALVGLRMGVRVDRPGVLGWDYHTAGAGVGIRMAEGGIKYTATTKEPETLLSRRQYLYDASFLVALEGEAAVVGQVIAAFSDPVWPVFLGRKCCVPSEPILAGQGNHADLRSALSSQPFFSGTAAGEVAKCLAIIEHPDGREPPDGSTLVYDVPRTFLRPSHGPRWVVAEEIEVPTARLAAWGPAPMRRRAVDYSSPQWKEVRQARLTLDSGLCVFCKSPAEEVHHVTYDNVGAETTGDLRSLCSICHDACTQLEYGNDLRMHRIDPADPGQRDRILAQVQKLLAGRRLSRRRNILQSSRESLFFEHG